MPPPTGDPQTPRNKDSSSSLLASFRSLTGSRPRNSPSNATPSATPPISTTSNPFDSPTGLTAHEHVDQAAADALRAVSDAHGDSSQVMARPSGPPGLRNILGDLKSEKSGSQRTSAAKAITKLLGQYTGADVVQIWNTGKDLLNVKSSRETNVEAYRLLNACICHKSLGPLERSLFFHSISEDSSPSLLGLRIGILRNLTDNGGNIADLGTIFMAFLVRLMKSNADTLKPLRKDRKTSGNKKVGAEEEKNMVAIFDYILDVLKYNSKAFGEVELDLLLQNLHPIAQKTTEHSDLKKAADIIDALITYSCLPTASLHPCVEILCGMYVSVPKLREDAWRAVVHLLGSHLGPKTMNAMIHILKIPSDKMNRMRAYGACALICAVLQNPDLEDPSSNVMPKLVSACRQALRLAENRSLEQQVLRLVLLLCNADDPAATIFNEKIWTNISEIMQECTARVKSQSSLPMSHLSLIDDRAPSSSIPNTESESAFRTVELIRQIARRLTSIPDEVHTEQRLQAMRLLMRIADVMDDEQADTLIEFYAEACLLYTFHDEWIDDCRTLLNSIFLDYDRATSVRRKALKALRHAHGVAEVSDTSSAKRLLFSILHCITPEPEPAVIEDLCQMATVVGTDTVDEDTFGAIVESLTCALHEGIANGQTSSNPFGLATFAHRIGFQTEKPHDSLSTSIAKTIVKIFLRCVNVSGWKAKILYDTMLSVARSNEYAAEARIVVLKLLFRLRAESNYDVFIISRTECEEIAALLCRTADTVNEPKGTVDSPVLRPSRPEEQFARRSNQPAAPTKVISRSNLSNTWAGSSTARLSKPTPPLWLYPGPGGLPEEPSSIASPLVTSRNDPDSNAATQAKTELRVGAWLELLLEILQQDELEWEVYSYTLVHLGAQLTNHALFVQAIPQVQMLRSVICSQLANKNFHEPPAFTGLKKSDAAICLYHILTMLVSYRRYFSKGEEDDVVKMFVTGIGSWERTSEVCIHALSICCHELPGSLTKVLENTLQRTTQIITQSSVAVHILEFLATLARLPELYRNFREEEFKIVFGICFRYLQDVRESRSKGSDRTSARISNSQSRPISHAKEQTLTTSRPTSLAGSGTSDDLPQYVYALAYHVMTFWFMSLKLQDRSKHIEWISRNLLYTDLRGREVMEEQGQVTIDMMQRVAFSDMDETEPRTSFAKEHDGITATKSWVVGKSIVTIETAAKSGLSQIIRRRPTGTTYSTFRPVITKPPRHQAPITTGTAAESFYSDHYVGVLPDHVFQEFYAFQDYLSAPFSFELPDEESVHRALKTFDHIDPLDGHKVGIIFVGEGQTAESEILSNVMGSADYTHFLKRIGTMIELCHAPMNTQGLDRGETALDGEYTYAWRDRVTEVVFHIPTMMPNHEHDTNRTFKKRHIGNDFVNIIFNNSGRSWDINNIPSDFNSINIVIAPEARASFVETRLSAAAAAAKYEESIKHDESRPGSPDIESPSTPSSPYDGLYYKVTVLTKPGIPAMSPAHITKILSGASLPAFVRLLAINASSFMGVWANRESTGGSGEHPSSWRSRLKEISKLRERFGPKDQLVIEPPRSSAGMTSPPVESPSISTGAALPSKTSSIQSTNTSALSARDSAFFSRRASKPNISATLSSADATDMERSSSQGSSTRTLNSTQL